jgi:hypothetical protein
MEIGNAVRRAESAEAKWHRVESVVADAAIVRCGRRMEPDILHGAGLQVADGEAAVTFLGGPSGCKRCAGPVVDPWA